MVLCELATAGGGRGGAEVSRGREAEAHRGAWHVAAKPQKDLQKKPYELCG